MVNIFSTCVTIILSLSFVSGFPRDLADGQGEQVVSRVKRMDDEDVPPPFGLFPRWKPQKTTRSTWFIFNFPTTYRSTTPSPRTTTKQRTPPAPKQPPTPPIPTKSPVPPTPAKSATPASTAKRSDQVTTAQTEKLPTTATETKPMETSTLVITTKSETTQIHTATSRPKTTSTTATTATTATTQAPTTTPQPTIENIPGALWVEDRYKRYLPRFGQYVITANITSGPPVLILRPQPLSRRDHRVKKYFSKCEVRILSKKDRSQKKFEAEYSKTDKRCVFTIKTLSPNTSFSIRARMKTSRVVLHQKMYKWSLRYEGFETGDYVYQEKIKKKEEKTKKKEVEKVKLPPECRDTTWKCAGFAKRGACINNPRYMENNCARSCPGLCWRKMKIKAALAGKDVCVDMSHSCKAWKRSRYCTSNRFFMWEKCRETCGWCRPSKSSIRKDINKLALQGPCKDTLRSDLCRVWAKQGACRFNSLYMYGYCFKSCNHVHKMCP